MPSNDFLLQEFRLTRRVTLHWILISTIGFFFFAYVFSSIYGALTGQTLDEVTFIVSNLGDLGTVLRSFGLFVGLTLVIVLPHELVHGAFMKLGENGRSGWDLFQRLLEEGAQAMLWYGYQTENEEAWKEEFFEEKIGSLSFDGDAYNLWMSVIVVNAFTDPETSATHPGVFGIGVICGNVGDRTIDRCREVGEALSTIYSDALLPDGNDGSLSFTELHY